MAVITGLERIESLLFGWNEDLGRDETRYRNHVYRVLNFAVAHSATDDAETIDILAIAAAFHDIGIWTDRTLDYIEPSIELAQRWLSENALSARSTVVSDIIRWHHKITPWRGANTSLVESFRRSDWLDVCLFAMPTSLPRVFLGEVLTAFPREGFHRRLTELTAKWLPRHPLRPLPMFRW